MTTPMSIPSSDVAAYGAVPLQYIRDQNLSARHSRFLRRFVQPYMSNVQVAQKIRQGDVLGPDDTEQLETALLCVIMPMFTVREAAPPEIRDFAAAIAEPQTDPVQWLLDRSWIGDPDYAIPESWLDVEFGEVLPAGDWHDWDNAPQEPDHDDQSI